MFATFTELFATFIEFHRPSLYPMKFYHSLRKYRYNYIIRYLF